MNFIEQFFRVAPDRGDGSLEWMLLGVILVLLVCSLMFVEKRKNVPDRILRDREAIRAAVMRVSTHNSVSVVQKHGGAVSKRLQVIRERQRLTSPVDSAGNLFS